jgi:hypothetical protein
MICVSNSERFVFISSTTRVTLPLGFIKLPAGAPIRAGARMAARFLDSLPMARNISIGSKDSSANLGFEARLWLTARFPIHNLPCHE